METPRRANLSLGTSGTFGDNAGSHFPTYLAEIPMPETSTAPSVVVRGLARGLKVDIQAGGHSLSADEAVAIGGTATAPTPNELLLSALGACTAMTLRVYSDRKKYPLETVEVRLSHEKVPAAPGQDESTKIVREIKMTGALDDEMRKRLLEIADKCPVHKSLVADIQAALG